jgi:hypothetical protein
MSPPLTAVAFLPFTLAVAVACESRPAPQPAAATTASARSDARPVIDDTSFRYPAAERIVAIGDLHGDVQATRAALRLAGALGADDHWAGGKLVVVQTGDQLDRGDDEPDILDLLERLSAEAAAAGGALHALNGNHEVMNVEGDFRYVTPDGFRDYQATDAASIYQPMLERLPAEQRGRAAAFLPGEEVAKRLAKRQSIIQVGDSVFVHGGILARHVRRGLGKINREIQEWMAAPSTKEPPSIATDQRGPLWLRMHADGVPTSTTCKDLETALDWLSAKRMVVGHTVQKQGINSACQGRVWRIDVGLARHYGNPPSVLEIVGDKTRIIEGSGAPPAPLASTSAPPTKRPAASAK